MRAVYFTSSFGAITTFLSFRTIQEASVKNADDACQRRPSRSRSGPPFSQFWVIAETRNQSGPHKIAMCRAGFSGNRTRMARRSHSWPKVVPFGKRGDAVLERRFRISEGPTI